MRGGCVAEQPQPVVVDEAVDKEKKKRNRRSNRRSNKNSSACNSVNEICGEATQSTKNDYKVNNLTPYMNCSLSKQEGIDLQHSSVLDPTRASNVTFSSMPTMHINEDRSAEPGSTQSQLLLPIDLGGRTILRSCPAPVANDYEGSCWTYTNKDDNPSHHSEEYAQSKIFAPHWSTEAVNDSLQKGDAFKALFRVNAHNRLEAYCKIEGLQTDVLIGGIAAQNRAVEGDVVLIKIDPLLLWTKMKGSANNSSVVVQSSLLPEANGVHGDTCKVKSKVDVSYEYANCTMLPDKGINSEDGSSSEAYNRKMVEQGGYSYINGHHSSASDSTEKVSSSRQNVVMNAIEKLSVMISLYPTKRPTGRVVAIIERSPRRDGIVGFLNVNQWFYFKEGCKKDMKKNMSSLSIPDREYIWLTPTDPKFPKMVVLVKDVPDSIKERLGKGDATVEMELVAAKIDEWNEESPFPQAHVSRVFGRGGEVETQINAILYENAICCSEFSPESLSCLPSVPWEVPHEELYNRKDLRNLCIFTIDPSMATDLDDALSIERLSDGIFRVGVHIADVSYFVLPDTALDTEAQIRSTSVYTLQQKIPMLPMLLYEELCSLNPAVDRLAFSIFWDLNGTGDVVDHWIGRTVIRSCCKLSYEHAQDVIDGKFDAASSNNLGDGQPQLYGLFEWADIVRSVKSLYEVSKRLKDKRFNDGALLLESSKPVFLFDEYGTPFDSVLSGRKESNFLVEEFMLLANKTAAEVISRAFPDNALLRRHPAPNMRKLREFEAFCFKHGLKFDSSSSGQFHHSLEQAREKLKDDYVLFDILINYATRPMQLASYFCSGDFKDVADWGHYALAVPLFTHFTSPLRRYPDIVVHRTLAAALEAEELYWKHRTMKKIKHREEVRGRFLTGIYYDKDAAESLEGREALSVAALKHGVPCSDMLVNVAAYCNDRKLACRNVKDACEKLCMWVLLKKKEVLLSEARVMALGPRFMTIYIQKLAIERRIYYDEVEGLIVEWLEATSTLVLDLCVHKRSSKRGGSSNYRAFEEVALFVRPNELREEQGLLGGSVNKCTATDADIKRQRCGPTSNNDVDPGVFPLTVHLLSTIPVALHAIGGVDGPLDIGVRLYMSTYLR